MAKRAPEDGNGREIKVGDLLSLCVGIPGRDVVVAVKIKRGRLVVEDAEGSMALSLALKYFPAYVVK